MHQTKIGWTWNEMPNVNAECEVVSFRKHTMWEKNALRIIFERSSSIKFRRTCFIEVMLERLACFRKLYNLTFERKSFAKRHAKEWGIGGGIFSE